MDAFLRCGDPHFGFPRLRSVTPDCSTKAEQIVFPRAFTARDEVPEYGTRMPPLASRTVGTHAVELIWEWVDGLGEP